MAENTNVPAQQSSETTKKTLRSSWMNEYLDLHMAEDIRAFSEGGNLKTGYENLDAITNLYPGLYVIGAVSSLGKTTFVHQMADQLAASGRKVLFFSLEQSTLELATKSLSRITAMTMASEQRMTSLQIRKSGDDLRVIQAADYYRSHHADNLWIAECSFRATIDNIIAAVKENIAGIEQKPVVIIDYLQVIQPDENSRLSVRETIDSYVRKLKELQTDHKLVVIVVSSFNRGNYMNLVDFESFKESGGIEYTADVVWGLQLRALRESGFEDKKINEKREIIRRAKMADPREIELICLKNRFGRSSYSCFFQYFPQWDYFRPDMSSSVEEFAQSGHPDLDGFFDIPEDYDVPFT